MSGGCLLIGVAYASDLECDCVSDEDFVPEQRVRSDVCLHRATIRRARPIRRACATVQQALDISSESALAEVTIEAGTHTLASAIVWMPSSTVFLKIVGNGATIDCSAVVSRCLQIEVTTLQLVNLTFSQASGGVLVTSIASLAVAGCAFSACTADEGAAILSNDGASLEISGTRFTDCRASAGSGGAISVATD